MFLGPWAGLLGQLLPHGGLGEPRAGGEASQVSTGTCENNTSRFNQKFSSLSKFDFTQLYVLIDNEEQTSGESKTIEIAS